MIILTALLLAAQPATPARPGPRKRRPAAASVVKSPPTSDWLKGLWVAEADKGEAMEGCADWTALFFQADGHYLQGQATGRWTLEGDRLIRQQFAEVEGGGDEEQPADEGVPSRVARLAEDRLRLSAPDGKATLYLRCPTPETPVAR